MNLEDFEDDLSELESAEDFLNYFGVPFEQSVVNVNRLHILQRFHNYLSGATMPETAIERKAIYLNALNQAYQDFVNSDARTEKVLRIYQKQSGTSFVPFDKIGRASS